jgi:hypothetical protein
MPQLRRIPSNPKRIRLLQTLFVRKVPIELKAQITKVPTTTTRRDTQTLFVRKVPAELKTQITKVPTTTRRRDTQTLFFRKVPAEPKAPVETSVTVRHYKSTSPYAMPTLDTKIFWDAAHQPSINPVENAPPPNLDNESPSERVKRTLDSANAKRKEREAWLARTGGTTLTISLLFSPKSQASIETFRNKHYLERTRLWSRFDMFHRLPVDRYWEYEDLLTHFAKRWKPFAVAVKPSGCILENQHFKVGLQLESTNLEWMNRALRRDIGTMHPWTMAPRIFRSRELLTMTMINRDKRELQDANSFLEQWEQASRYSFEDLRVEGLVLRGRRGGLDTVFPPPQEFPFSGGEAAG